MRSELVFGAMANVSNRYLLVKLASTATRKLHRPHTRIQDTMNDTFARFSHANPLADAQGSCNVEQFPHASRTKDQSLRAYPEQSVA